MLYQCQAKPMRAIGRGRLRTRNVNQTAQGWHLVMQGPAVEAAGTEKSIMPRAEIEAGMLILLPGGTKRDEDQCRSCCD